MIVAKSEPEYDRNTREKRELPTLQTKSTFSTAQVKEQKKTKKTIYPEYRRFADFPQTLGIKPSKRNIRKSAQSMCYAKLCEVTRNRNVVPGDIFPPYRTVCMKVTSSTLMRMLRLIWVCAGRKGLIIPKVFSKFPHSNPPKLGQFPCFLKILTNAALFPEYILVLPRSKENPGSPIHCSST